MEKVGRIGRTKRRLGNLFGLRPTVSLKNNSLEIVETVRGNKRLLIIEPIGKDTFKSPGKCRFFVVHGGKIEGQNILRRKLKKI